MIVGTYDVLRKVDLELAAHTSMSSESREFMNRLLDSYDSIGAQLGDVLQDLDSIQFCGDTEMFDSYVDMARERVQKLHELVTR